MHLVWIFDQQKIKSRGIIIHPCRPNFGVARGLGDVPLLDHCASRIYTTRVEHPALHVEDAGMPS